MHNIGDLDVPELVLTPSSTNFYEHKKCFKQCLKDMKESYLTQEEEKCSRTCLGKHLEAMTFVQQKMTHHLTQLVTQDPRLKMAFSKQQNIGVEIKQ